MEIKLALSFDDVLLVPKKSTINSRSDVDLSTKIGNVKLNIPLISTNMDTVTGVAMAIKMYSLGGLGILPRFKGIDFEVNEVKEITKSKAKVAASIGVKDDYLNDAKKLVSAGCSILNIDVAHGHMQQTLEATKNIKNYFKDKITLISGISATGEATEDLFINGADAVFLGVGGGSICTTRVQTGCGLPTFESIIRSENIAKKYKKQIIAGAGIKNSGDIVKSLAAGCGAVALGFMLAGSEDTPGDILEIDGKKYKRYSGSTSEEQKNKHVNEYKQQKNNTYTLHIEGVKGLVEYRGETKLVIEKLLAGVRSGMSYCGAINIKELQKNAEFVQITSLGAGESKSHDVITHIQA